MKVAILGAGDLGATLARTLAARDRFAEIVLIDAARDVAAGKALDLLEAAPLEGSRTRLVATPDSGQVAGAAVVVIADGVGPPSAEWSGEPAERLIKEIADVSDGAPIVLAGCTQLDVIWRVCRDRRPLQTRLIGSAPLALTAAVRALVALEARVPAESVAVAVLGAPPDRALIAWSQATIGGLTAANLLPAAVLARISSRLPSLWPLGPYALASAAAAVCDAIARDRGAILPCFVALDESLGARNAVAAVPARLGRAGVLQIEAGSLEPAEQTAFQNAVLSRAR